MTRVVPALGKGAAQVEPIAADRLIEGAPVTRTVLDYECDLGSPVFRPGGASEGARPEALYVGEWASDVGAWRVAYDEWEYCHMLEGVCELVSEDGVSQRFAAGDSFVIEPGFKGVWRVLEPMRKKFVVRL